jgi:prepilin-type N-terminal cleavage/methylation domain-containing protein
MNTVPKQKGFSLLEMLIVVAIIVILTGIVLTLINPIKYYKEARDARRINDFLNLQTALIGAIANGDISLTDTFGCTTCDSFNGTTSADGTGWIVFNPTSEKGFKTFMQNLPSDPLNDAEHHYSFYSDGEDFELNVRLESEKYMENAMLDGGNDPDVYERGLNLNLN